MLGLYLNSLGSDAAADHDQTDLHQPVQLLHSPRASLIMVLCSTGRWTVHALTQHIYSQIRLTDQAFSHCRTS